jgi:molybdopterin-guanine dinucleotide biosynthesis protein A
MDIPAVSGIVLAGGESRRMGADKGLTLLQGRPLVEHVIERLEPQVRDIVISANAPGYERFGHPVIGDRIAEPNGSRAGPLAGLHAAMSVVTQPMVAVVPCDAPFIPVDYVRRLHDALTGGAADVAVARVGGRRQPVFVLAKREAAAALETYLRNAGRRADGWYGALKSVEVSFDDEASAFESANTPEQLRAMER